MDVGEWYIEVNGKKVGPFTRDQLQGLLDDGEIRDYHQVASVVTGGQWVSVQEALQGAPLAAPACFPDTVTGAALEPAPTKIMTGEFNPPPRPELARSGIIEAQPDAETSLFDALQVQKEKRSVIGPASLKSGRQKKPLFRVPNVSAKLAAVRQVTVSIPLTPRMFLIAAFTGMVLGSLTFGVLRMFKHHPVPPPGSFTAVSRAHVEPIRNPSIPITPERPIPRPVFTEPRHRIIPPPPPPAHVAVPPHFNPIISAPRPAPENNEPPREENPQPQDNGYPPPDNNNGNDVINGNDGAKMNNPANNPGNNGYPPADNNGDQPNGQQQPGEPNGAGGVGGGAQNPNPVTPPANAPGQDQFQPVQNSQGQNQEQPYGQ